MKKTRGLTKREPIGYSKTSLNPDSVHCMRRSNKYGEHQNNSIHITIHISKKLSDVAAHGTSVQVILPETGNEIGCDRTV